MSEWVWVGHGGSTLPEHIRSYMTRQQKIDVVKMLYEDAKFDGDDTEGWTPPDELDDDALDDLLSNHLEE